MSEKKSRCSGESCMGLYFVVSPFHGLDYQGKRGGGLTASLIISDTSMMITSTSARADQAAVEYNVDVSLLPCMKS